MSRAVRAHPTWSRKALQADADFRRDQSRLSSSGSAKSVARTNTTTTSRRSAQSVASGAASSRSSASKHALLLSGGAHRVLCAHQQHSLAPPVRGGLPGVLYESRTAKLSSFITINPNDSAYVIPGISDTTGGLYTHVNMSDFLTCQTWASFGTFSQMPPIGISQFQLNNFVSNRIMMGGLNTQLLSTSIVAEVNCPFDGAGSIQALSPGEGGRYLGGEAPTVSKVVNYAAGDVSGLNDALFTVWRYDASQHPSTMLNNSTQFFTGASDTAKLTAKAVGTCFSLGMADRGPQSSAALSTLDYDNGNISPWNLWQAMAAGRPCVAVTNTSMVPITVKLTSTYTWAIKMDPGDVEPIIPYGVADGGNRHELDTDSFRSSMSSDARTRQWLADHPPSVDLVAGSASSADGSLVTVPRIIRSLNRDGGAALSAQQISPALITALGGRGNSLMRDGQLAFSGLSRLAQTDLPAALASRNPAAILGSVANNFGTVTDTAKSVLNVARGVDPVHNLANLVGRTPVVGNVMETALKWLNPIDAISNIVDLF